MRRLIRILLPLLVLAGAASLAYVTVANRPEPERRPPREVVTEVEVLALARGDFPVWVHSRGTVRPRTESTLIPEVSGRIVELSPQLRSGAFFEAGDLLLRIDPRDYEAEVTVAGATLAQARSALAEEQARADQARRDWGRLGETGKADDLVLRKPQLAGARAAVMSAEARLTRARLDLERTTIRAPYAGRVLERNVDVGQYVAPGTTIARVYAVDYAEVRLPLTNRQLEFVEVPELFRGDGLSPGADGPPLELSARVGARTHTWQGRVVRAEGAIDTGSRQLFVVGQVDDPYGKGLAGRPPLKVGQFVEARIQGRTLEDVFVIPRTALLTGARVQVLDADGRVRARPVEVIYSDAEHAVIGEGVSDGERLVTTSVGPGMEGVRVRIAGQADQDPPRRPGDAGRGRPGDGEPRTPDDREPRRPGAGPPASPAS